MPVNKWFRWVGLSVCAAMVPAVGLAAKPHASRVSHATPKTTLMASTATKAKAKTLSTKAPTKHAKATHLTASKHKASKLRASTSSTKASATKLSHVRTHKGGTTTF